MALRDDSFRETNRDTWDWSDTNSLESLRSLSGDSACLIWTSIEELDAFVLNVVAPKGHVFWDVSDGYAAFIRGAARFSQALSLSLETRDRLRDVLEEAGIERRSFCSHVVFGGLTRPYGDYFLPVHLGGDYFLLAQRHMSIGVPASCRPAVARYFHRQMASFGDRALRECAEHSSLYGNGIASGSLARSALVLPLDALSSDERFEALDAMENGHWQAGRDFDLSHACRGIEIALLKPPAPDEVNSISALSRRRVELALDQGSLLVLERMKARLETPGWNSLSLADLREELRAALDTRLAGYPIIQTDPFGEWNPQGS